MVNKLILAGAFAAAIAIAGSANAQTWNESGDAGSLPGTAQAPSGSGPLNFINGTSGGGDEEDMYQILFTGTPGAWGIATSPVAPPPGGSSSFDTQLWLFDGAGMGVVGNDDSPWGAPGFTSSLDWTGSGSPALVPGGTYYLAISGYNNDPESSPGANIFDFLGAPFDAMMGPGGPGGGSPVSGWVGGGATGSYTIALDGFSYVPEPATLSLLVLGGLALIRRR